MSELGDLIDVELLLHARSEGMGAFGESESHLRGIATAGVFAGVAIAATVAEIVKQTTDMAAQPACDVTVRARRSRR